MNDKLKVDITDLLIIFDDLLKPPTEEELGVYWFGIKRAEGINITLLFSIYECWVSIIVSTNGITTSSIDMKNCSEIRIIDQDKKCLEIIHSNEKGRCFLALTSDNILEYVE